MRDLYEVTDPRDGFKWIGIVDIKHDTFKPLLLKSAHDGCPEWTRAAPSYNRHDLHSLTWMEKYMHFAVEPVSADRLGEMFGDLL